MNDGTIAVTDSDSDIESHINWLYNDPRALTWQFDQPKNTGKLQQAYATTVRCGDADYRIANHYTTALIVKALNAQANGSLTDHVQHPTPRFESC